MDFIVGTFYTSKLFTLRFTPENASLEIVKTSEACGGHSWLALSPDRQFLYTTVWADPAAVAAYRILPDHSLQFLNSAPVKAMSGYVVASKTHLYSAGGPTGDVFALNRDGSIGALAQALNFRETASQDDGQREVAHGNFGGLRHGSHSVDFSPDGKALYIADIGHNCVWSYAVDETEKQPLKLGMKWIASRQHDGPRHTWPHPSGKYLYCLQEHSSMVDVLKVAEDGTTLELVQGARILPEGKDEGDFWADEVRLSRPTQGAPRYLYASTRGLNKDTMGYLAAFRLDDDGLIQGEALHIYETHTSGGIANAVEPAPATQSEQDVDYMALTDSQEGYVFVLSFDGKEIKEVARTRLTGDDERPLASATAVWL